MKFPVQMRQPSKPSTERKVHSTRRIFIQFGIPKYKSLDYVSYCDDIAYEFRPQSFSKHPDLFTELNDKAHGERRRIMNNVYSLANVLKSETYIDGCSELFLQRLSENVDAIEPFDLGTWVQWYVVGNNLPASFPFLA